MAKTSLNLLWKSQGTAHLLKSAKLFLKWVASTGAICSFLGCENQNLHPKKLSILRVGVQTPLLSLDPLSLNSFGEKEIFSLLREFPLDEQYVKDNLKNKSLSLKALPLQKIKDLKKEFLRLKKSSLWNPIALQFEIDDEKISYKQEKKFISSLKALTSLLSLSGPKYGFYEVKDHKKALHLKLKKKKKLNFYDEIHFFKIKNATDALFMLKAGKLDVFYPNEEVSHDLSDFNVLYHKDKVWRLSLYAQYGRNKVFDSFMLSLCRSQNEVLKSIGKTWSLKKSLCHKRKPKKSKAPVLKKLRVLADTNKVYSVFDIVSIDYKNKTGEIIDYKKFALTDLVKALKAKSFDLYLTEEVQSEAYPISYDTHHSKGRFNTLGVSDLSLDTLLEDLSLTQDLDSHQAQMKKVKRRAQEIEPVLLRLEKPKIQTVCSLNSKDCPRSSLKSLILKKALPK